MILRKIELLRQHRAHLVQDVPFENQLILWFDSASKKNIKAISEFLREHYQLRQKSDNYELENKGLSWTEYANNSLYRFRGDGNLGLEYMRAYKERGELLDKVNGINLSVAKGSSDPRKNENEVKKRLQLSADIVACDVYLQGLEALLREGNSVVLSGAANLDNLNYFIHYNLEPPVDYGNPQLSAQMVNLDFLPLRLPVIKELTGVLFVQGLEFETPRHHEVLQGILAGKIKAYQGHAYFEHHQREVA